MMLIPAEYELRNKWPQMLITGKPVTREQAEDIILKTDDGAFSFYSMYNMHMANKKEYFTKIGFYLLKDLNLAFSKLSLNVRDSFMFEFATYNIGSYVEENISKDLGVLPLEYCKNNIIFSSYINGSHGWCSPEGNIFYYDNVGKHPSTEDLIKEWSLIAETFPYLDLNITMMSDESCVYVEEGKLSVCNIKVCNGGAVLGQPDLSVHDFEKFEINPMDYCAYDRSSTNNYPSEEMLSRYTDVIAPLTKKYINEIMSSSYIKDDVSIIDICDKHDFL